MNTQETGLVRWSPNPAIDSFLHINLQHRVVQLYEPTGFARTGRFEYRNVSKHEDFPTLTTFDWSPSIPGLAAVGTPTGVVNLLKIDDNSNAYVELGLKMSRTCQAVAFSTSNLLAVGLDRVRSDRCLYVWDVNRLASSGGSGNDQEIGFPKDMEPFGDPVDLREPSVSVSSIRFFEDNPNTLVVGIKGQGLRIHDLRDPSNQTPSFQTRCNNNLAIDMADQNYFASSALDHPGVMIWDRRAGSRTMASPLYLDAVDVDEMPWGGALRLDRAVASGSEQAISESKNSVIRSLRYCRDHRGLLGVLSGAGQLKVYETQRAYCPPEMMASMSPELLEVRRSNEMDNNQYSDPRHKGERVVSFDWVTIGSPALRPRVLALQASGSFAVLEKPSFTTTYPFKLIPWTAPYRGFEQGTSYHGMLQLELAQAAEILGPVALEEALADIPIFASGPAEIEAAREAAAAQKEKEAAAEAAAATTGTETQSSSNRKKIVLSDEYYAATTVAEKLKMLRAVARRRRPRRPTGSSKRSGGGGGGMSDSTGSLSSVSTSGRPLTSQERHENLLASTLVRQGFPSEAQAVLDHVMLLRAKEGYLFDNERNREIVADDPWLRGAWGWVRDAEAATKRGSKNGGGMTAHHLDLSYLGVANIWLEDMGKQRDERIVEEGGGGEGGGREGREGGDELSDEELPETFPETADWQRTVASLCHRHGLPAFDGVETQRPAHRQMCLDMCEWGRPPPPDRQRQVPDATTAERTPSFHTMAAAQALFRGDRQGAVQILKEASGSHPELLFVSLALQLLGGEAPPPFRMQLDFDEALASKTDPYLRAISSLIATGDWTTIAHQSSLPLRDRVFVAVRTFGDAQLTRWLQATIATAVETADIEAIVLLGLSDGMVDVLARYVAKHGDIQTAALLMARTAPRFVDDYRCTAWRNGYRQYLQRHRAFFQRAKFEAESTQRSILRGADRPALAPPARQVALRCVYCDAQTQLTGSAVILPEPVEATTTEDNNATNTGEDDDDRPPAAVGRELAAKMAQAGVSCPNCKRHLPRCVVCLEIVGTPRAASAASAAMDADGALAAQFPAFCLRCDHVLHLDHARLWFARHAECPVPECRCRCNFRANPELYYR